MKKLLSLFSLLTVIALCVACGSKGGADGKTPQNKEDREAKAMLQGVWQDEETEEVSFWAKGDTIYYPDSISQPTPFAIIDGQLVLVSPDAHYHIEKQTDHVFWFKNQSGDIVRLVKSDEPLPDEFVRGGYERVMTYTEVVKQDSVIVYDNNHYHWYIAINPTKKKVHTSAFNDDGLEVDNVYYDNIMHVSLFRGATKFFSRDFRKQDYAGKVPEQFLSQSVLSNMEYTGVDARGFRFVATICIPDGASCYKAENVISFDGKLTMTLLEY